MKLLILVCLLVQLCVMLVSCEHRPLEDAINARYIRIYLDEEIKNVTCGFYNENYEKPEYSKPYVMRAMLADPNSGRIVSERYLQNNGSDEKGRYIDGYINAGPGKYNLLVYSFGSPITKIRNDKNYFTMEAYTNRLSEYYLQFLPETRKEINDNNIFNQPEHLFHDVCEPVVLSQSMDIDTLRNANGEYFKAHSMVKSYYFQIKVKGVEWVTTAVSLISGMAESTIMHEHEQYEDATPVHLFFSLKQADKKRRSGEDAMSAIMYTTFNTFGKLPDSPTVCTLKFEFTKSDGSSQVESIDISDMFHTPMVKENQWILLEKEIVITPPEGADVGGMTPNVDKWGESEEEIEL